jgi:hypothetical protein
MCSRHVGLEEEDRDAEQSRHAKNVFPKNLIACLPVQVLKRVDFRRPARPKHSCVQVHGIGEAESNVRSEALTELLTGVNQSDRESSLLSIWWWDL